MKSAARGISIRFRPSSSEQYLAIADKVLDRILAPEGAPAYGQSQKRLFGEPPRRGRTSREAAREVARSLARKAYRRPPSEAELDVLLRGVRPGKAKQTRLSGSRCDLMLKAILVSPQFLFITPAGEAEPSSGIVPLDDYQLASRLSYLLWATMPDDELMALADSGKLHRAGRF